MNVCVDFRLLFLNFSWTSAGQQLFQLLYCLLASYPLGILNVLTSVLLRKEAVVDRRREVAGGKSCWNLGGDYCI